MNYDFVEEIKYSIDIEFDEIYEYAVNYVDSNITCDEICDNIEDYIKDIYGVSPWNGNNYDVINTIISDFRRWKDQKLLR